LESYTLNNGTTTGLNDKQDNMSHDIKKLGDRMDKVEAKGAEESFEMEGFVYSLYGDFASSILSKRIPSCGIFWDLFSCLVSMRPKGLTGKERADEQHSSERINTSMLKNNLLASMGHA
jgi:hypothetical protein